MRGSTPIWFIIAAVISGMVTVARAQQVPCYFVFGDSVFDNGNNNNLKSQAKVNYSPYGIDFPKGPTGRFSNGRNIPDFIAQSLGFKDFIPPFAGSSPHQTAGGLNYASGGAGIRDETSQHLGARISLSRQIANHESAIKKAGVAPERLNKCLYMINIGSNDFINDYFMPLPYTTSSMYTPQAFAHALADQLGSSLKRLYGLGARKVAVLGIQSIGCIPCVVFTRGGGKGCDEKMNNAAVNFNTNMKSTIAKLNSDLAGAKFSFIDLFNRDTPPGKSCCRVEPGQDLCTPNGPVCMDRTKALFWDNVHGTEAINGLLAKAVLKALPASYFTSLAT